MVPFKNKLVLLDAKSHPPLFELKKDTVSQLTSLTIHQIFPS